MREDDLVRVKAMHDAASRALTLAEGRSRVDFENDLTLLLFTKKALEIMGTAASKTTRECQKQHGEFPWAFVAGFGRRPTKRKGLGEGHVDKMWTIVTSELPRLAGLLEGILAQEKDSNPNLDGG